MGRGLLREEWLIQGTGMGRKEQEREGQERKGKERSGMGVFGSIREHWEAM